MERQGFEKQGRGRAEQGEAGALHGMSRLAKGLCGRDVFGTAKERYSEAKHRRGVDGRRVAKAEQRGVKNGKAKAQSSMVGYGMVVYGKGDAIWRVVMYREGIVKNGKATAIFEGDYENGK